LSEHLRQFTDINPQHLYTMFCECYRCKNKKFVKVRTDQIPLVAEKMGYGDLITTRQFENIIHAVVQKLG
jgi:hypothetical protein